MSGSWYAARGIHHTDAYPAGDGDDGAHGDAYRHVYANGVTAGANGNRDSVYVDAETHGNTRAADRDSHTDAGACDTHRDQRRDGRGQ